MSEPIDIDPTQFFDFIARPGLVVVFLPLHHAHPFNRAFPGRMHDRDGGSVPVGRIALIELLIASAPAFAFLQQSLRARGVSRLFDVLPGYYLFENGHMITWEAGFPTTADLDAIVGASLLGLIGYAVSRRPMLILHALHYGTQEAVAARMAARFREAATEQKRAPHGPPPRNPIDELLNAYRLLGVDPNASDDEVNAAWRRRQIELHPDRAARDPAEFERRSRIVADLNRARELIRRCRAASRGANAWSCA